MSMFVEYKPEEHRELLLSSQDFILRPAHKSDIAALARLASERHGKPKGYYRSAFLREIRTKMKSGRCMLLVAQVCDSIAGYGRVSYFQPPRNAPATCAPEGWYLCGVIVSPEFRRRGIGEALTRQRLEWISLRTDQAFYFVNAQNRASIDLHAKLGCTEISRNFYFPKVMFEGGTGILYRIDLKGEWHAGTDTEKK